MLCVVIIFTSWTLACLSMAENIDGDSWNDKLDSLYVRMSVSLSIKLSTWHCHVINVL